MKKLNNKLWLVVILLFIVNCDNGAGSHTSKSGDVAAPTIVPSKIDDFENSIKIDTLCAYVTNSSIPKHYVFQDDNQLNLFLNSTGYDKDDATYRTIKKMAHEPNFKKYNYFAYSGNDWPRKIDILYEKDTIILNHIIYYPKLCDECPDPASPARVAVVYYIPFTNKTIKFEDSIINK